MAGETRAEQFEAHRAHLRAVAYRLLAPSLAADDAIDEASRRFGLDDARTTRGLRNRLTALVAEVALEMLRFGGADGTRTPVTAVSPGRSAAGRGDRVSPALLGALERLSPSERVAYVLHDLFAVPLRDVAAVLGRSANASNEIAGRARQKVRGREPALARSPARHRSVVAAVVTAGRSRDHAALAAHLSPDVVLSADAAARRLGWPHEVQGAAAVAAVVAERLRAAVLAEVDGAAGLAELADGLPVIVWDLTITGAGLIERIEVIAANETLSEIDLAMIRE